MSESPFLQSGAEHSSVQSRVDHFRASINRLHDGNSRSAPVVTYRQRMIQLLDESGEAALTREHPNAHFTASAFIFNLRGDALALFHRKLKRWLQPGGHIEQMDQSPLDAAIREAREESSLNDLQLIHKGPIDLDIHTIPSRPSEAEHEHFDIRFAFLTSSPGLAKLSNESSGLKWLGGDQLSGWMNKDESIRRPISLALKLIDQC